MFYDFNATSFHNVLNFWILFLHYFGSFWNLNIIIILRVLICLEKGSIDHIENFQSLWFKCQISYRNFPLNFLSLPVCVVVFITISLIVMSYWWPTIKKHHSFLVEAWLSVFIDFLWKLLTLMALILRVFRKNFVVLVYLLIYVDLKSVFLSSPLLLN